MKQNNPNKNGIKLLSESQLKITLPSITLLDEKLQEIRKNAYEAKLSSEINMHFDHLKYDNIISILGGRGAGKTSVLKTLIHRYDDTSKFNIVLPMVMPELIDGDEDIFSWIISAMKEHLQNFENKLKCMGQIGSTEYEQTCKEYNLFERCQFNKNNGLRKAFQELSDAYFVKKSRNERVLIGEASESDALISSYSFSLISKFADYWTKLAKLYREYIIEKEYNHRKDDTQTVSTTPMIYIFIDDADLKPQIINDLIFLLPKYLSHPNVVVFVSASQKTLKYAVKNHMFRSLTGNEFRLFDLMEIEQSYMPTDECSQTIRLKELRYGKEYDKIDKLTEDILRKIFPIYNRFYIKSFNSYSEKTQIISDDNITIKELISDALKSFRDEILEKHRCAGGDYNISIQDKKLESFSVINNTGELSTSFFLSFLGRYPRDIWSAYFALLDLLSLLREAVSSYYGQEGSYKNGEALPDRFINQVYEALDGFLCAVISSNVKFKPFFRYTKELIIKQMRHWQLYVNYGKILEIFQTPAYYEQNKAEPECFGEMFALMHLLEQFVVLVMPQRKTVHGIDEFKVFLNLCNVNIIKTSKTSKDFSSIFRQYSLFHDYGLLKNFDIYKREHQENFLYAVRRFQLVDLEKNSDDDKKSDENEKTIAQKFYSEYTKDSSWCEMLLTVMVVRFELLYKFYQEREKLFLVRNKTLAGPLYKELCQKWNENIEQHFMGEKNNDTVGETVSSDDIHYNLLELDMLLQQLTFKSSSELVEEIANFKDEHEFTTPYQSKRTFESLYLYLNKENAVVDRRRILSMLTRLVSIPFHNEELKQNSLSVRQSLIALLENVLTEVAVTPRGYKSLIDIIKKQGKTYITGLIRDFKSENLAYTMSDDIQKMFDFYQELKADSISQRINIIKQTQWYKLLEKVEEDGKENI